MKISNHFVLWIEFYIPNCLCIKSLIQYDHARRAFIFHSLASQQKVKRRIYSASCA